MKHLKQKILTLLKVLLALGLIVWLVQSGKLDFSDLGVLISPEYLVPCILLTGFGLALSTERWKALMASQGITLGSFRVGQLVLMGTFFNYFMPGGVGGDVVKAFYIARDFPNSKTKVVVSVLMDRIVGLFSMVVMALGIMLWQWHTISTTPQLKFIFTMLCFILVAFLVFWSLIFSIRLEKEVFKFISFLPGKHSIKRILQSLTSYRIGKRQVFVSFLLSMLAQMSAILFFYVAGNGLGFSQVPFTTYLFVVPVGFMIQAIPIAPAGIGIGQAAFLFLFNLAMQDKTSLGPATITAFQLATFLYGLLGAICYLNISRQIKDMTPMEVKTNN